MSKSSAGHRANHEKTWQRSQPLTGLALRKLQKRWRKAAIRRPAGTLAAPPAQMDQNRVLNSQSAARSSGRSWRKPVQASPARCGWPMDAS